MVSAQTKLRIQNFGRFLSNMVMPNIGAFIAWGLLPHYLFRQVGCQTKH